MRMLHGFWREKITTQRRKSSERESWAFEERWRYALLVQMLAILTMDSIIAEKHRCKEPQHEVHIVTLDLSTTRELQLAAVAIQLHVQIPLTNDIVPALYRFVPLASANLFM